MEKNKLLERIRHRLIVSCQARKGWAMHGPEIMAAFARAAQEGGASALRLNGAADIHRVRQQTELPIIGINKIWTEDSDVYITPTFASAEEVLREGIDIIALDATPRSRPGGETFAEIVGRIRAGWPEVLIMGEVSTCEEGIAVSKEDVDLISTTLSGYTPYSKKIDGPDLELIRQLHEKIRLPIIAEGRISTPEEAGQALAAGAHAVVVGTAITRPEVITKKFVHYIDGQMEAEGR